MTSKTLGNEYARSLYHHDLQQINAAPSLPATIWLVGHDVVDRVIIYAFGKLHENSLSVINKKFVSVPRNKFRLRRKTFWRFDCTPIQRQ